MKNQSTLILAAALGLAASAQAAVVTWSSYTATDDTDISWMSNPTQIVCAANLGGEAASFAGITWGNDGAGQGANLCSFFYTRPPGAVTVSYSNPSVSWGSPSGGMYPGGTVPGATDVLGSCAYGASDLYIGGLTVGQEYEIKFLVADTRYLYNPPGSTVNFGQGSGNMVWVFDNNKYLVATATFTADASSITFTPGIINAVSVAAIPEPSAALLGGLGMLALLRRRR